MPVSPVPRAARRTPGGAGRAPNLGAPPRRRAGWCGPQGARGSRARAARRGRGRRGRGSGPDLQDRAGAAPLGSGPRGAGRAGQEPPRSLRGAATMSDQAPKVPEEMFREVKYYAVGDIDPQVPHRPRTVLRVPGSAPAPGARLHVERPGPIAPSPPAWLRGGRAAWRPAGRRWGPEGRGSAGPAGGERRGPGSGNLKRRVCPDGGGRARGWGSALRVGCHGPRVVGDRGAVAELPCPLPTLPLCGEESRQGHPTCCQLQLPGPRQQWVPRGRVGYGNFGRRC